MYEYYHDYRRKKFKYDVSPCDETERDMNFALFLFIFLMILFFYCISGVFKCFKELPLQVAAVTLLFVNPVLMIPFAIYIALGGCDKS